MVTAHQRASWAFDLHGPNVGGVKAPSLGYALSIAQARADVLLRDDAEARGVWTITEWDDVVAKVTLRDGVITTEAGA